MEYSCQRKERLRVQAPVGHTTHDGAYSYRCLGTEVHLTYSSTSIWSMPTFTVQVQENKCGYYRPDRHVENEFYPPCVVSQFPVQQGIFPIKFVDPFYQEGRYFNLLVRYRDKDYSGKVSKCPNQCRNLDELHIISKQDAFAWSQLPQLPFRWRTWGRTKPEGNWTRELIVTRGNQTDESCRLVPGCEINVEFFGSVMNKVILPGNSDISCPEPYTQIGSGCYMIAWPEDPRAGPDGIAMSWEDAKSACQRSGGSLIIINTAEEAEDIKINLFYNWWEEHLQRVPGVKVLHIGLRWSQKVR